MIQSDEPIESKEQDHLGRFRTAQIIANEIRNVDSRRGAVIGVLGPWGSGKTSLINMIRKELEAEPAYSFVDFNPWLFSGSDDLVRSFFGELSEQLRIGKGKLYSLADQLEHYGDVVAPLQVLPVVGSWIGRISGTGQAVKKLRGKGEGGVGALRKKINEHMKGLTAPIVVIVDDVDRLPTSEIREIFKLVRLTASFPNIIYVVAFDRVRVETALAEDGLPGRDYLEKIIQVNYDVPAIPDSAIREQLLQALDDSLQGIENTGSFDTERWPDVFEEVIRPLIRNIRDVRRYTASLRGSVSSLDGQVELVDVLAIEAVRVFLPDTYSSILENQRTLTVPSREVWGSPDPQEEHLRNRIEGLLETAPQHQPLVNALVGRLFPTASRFLGSNSYAIDRPHEYLKRRRLAHPDVLQFYLERMAGKGLRVFWAAERAYDLLADQRELNDHLRKQPPHELADIVKVLESYEAEYPVEAVVPASIVLLNLLPDIPKRKPSMFDFFDENTIVASVVLRLLRRIDSPEAIAAATTEILPSLDSLSSQLQLIRIVGHEDNIDHELVTFDASRKFESELRSRIRHTSLGDLTREHDLFRLLTWIKATSSATEPSFDIPVEKPIAGAILKAALTEIRSQGSGTRSIKTEQVLYWESLVELLGGESGVEALIQVCMDEEDTDIVTARNLAQKYLSGWRPERY